VRAKKRCAAFLSHPIKGVAHVSSLPQLRSVRFLPVRGYPNCLIYYRPLPDGIEVLRVIERHRDRRQAALSRLLAPK
jgi:hypothetical protein